MAIYLGTTNDGTFVSSDGYRLLDLNSSILYALPESSKWKINLNGVVYHLNVNLDTKESE